MKRSIEERFWEKVAKSDLGCWEWNGTRDRKGYGKINIGRKLVFAHRLSYALNVGELPANLFVCHRCDNPCCVRPDHLFLGTHADNRRDMLAKGRGVDSHPVCRKGHLYAEGTFVMRKRGNRRFRRCLLCERPVRAEWYRQRRKRGAA